MDEKNKTEISIFTWYADDFSLYQRIMLDRLQTASGENSFCIYLAHTCRWICSVSFEDERGQTDFLLIKSNRMAKIVSAVPLVIGDG